MSVEVSFNVPFNEAKEDLAVVNEPLAMSQAV
jgi:hypothetical protein